MFSIIRYYLIENIEKLTKNLLEKKIHINNNKKVQLPLSWDWRDRGPVTRLENEIINIWKKNFLKYVLIDIFKPRKAAFYQFEKKTFIR